MDMSRVCLDLSALAAQPTGMLSVVFVQTCQRELLSVEAGELTNSPAARHTQLVLKTCVTDCALSRVPLPLLTTNARLASEENFDHLGLKLVFCNMCIRTIAIYPVRQLHIRNFYLVNIQRMHLIPEDFRSSI